MQKDITFFVEKFLSHSTKMFHWRTLRCFSEIVLSKIFKHKRGGASRLCRIFLSHRAETKSFPENFWYRKKFMDEKGHITISVEIFMSHSAKNFRQEILLLLRNFLVSKSFIDEKAGYLSFPSKNFGLTVPKKFVGIPSMYRKIWSIKKFHAY